MSTVYNPEADLVAEIERLEIEARELHRRLKRAKHAEDIRALNRLLSEAQAQVDRLRGRLP